MIIPERQMNFHRDRVITSYLSEESTQTLIFNKIVRWFYKYVDI